jgi:hypothetical protein
MKVELNVARKRFNQLPKKYRTLLRQDGVSTPKERFNVVIIFVVTDVCCK